MPISAKEAGNFLIEFKKGNLPIIATYRVGFPEKRALVRYVVENPAEENNYYIFQDDNVMGVTFMGHHGGEYGAAIDSVPLNEYRDFEFKQNLDLVKIRIWKI